MITLNDPTKEEFLAAAKVGVPIRFTLTLEGKEFEFERLFEDEAALEDTWLAFTYAKARTIRNFYTEFYLNKIHESADWSSSAVTLCNGVVEHIQKNFPPGNLALLQSAVTRAMEQEKAEYINR